MVNRAQLLQALEPLIEPSPTEREGLRTLLDKTLVQASIALPLEAARQLPASAKNELEIIIRELYLPKELQRLAGKWEPSRKLDADLKDTLRSDLIDLLHGRRPKYTGLAIVPLEEARKDAAHYREYVTRNMPTNDAKKLLKAWDKKIKPMPTARKQIIQHLVRLLNNNHSASKQVA